MPIACPGAGEDVFNSPIMWYHSQPMQTPFMKKVSAHGGFSVDGVHPTRNILQSFFHLAIRQG
jgi:hypothetical protein